ncbi:probable serine/threonine-protein kinase nek3 isoform X2 [Toxorhynchites rutilus septentrionalis]|uniref:probable serine/threonine-protein kinase nek3 isoform X2 n=1 Tax=Toxorhynchites rutilus septentrionalis TaxID=329112 RepID=UPI002479F70E|nr:probable serine/threonine-protein kinase nek3 isoform X2 [Toxorhynchites rutilus septentrionalis]
MNGLTTLNRLLGKRNKEVSKSTTNLSRSTTNLDTSSQYNKIVPLAAMTNAPFEQTFRITVLLPRDQLYVARIGAKTRLSALMDMICSDKQLDAQKYLFRHPADYQQGFELDLTIGEVGLNEIRLVSKKELENLQHNEYRLSTSDIFRLHQKNIRESSVSSSDLSRTSKMVLKTTSPYSSTNSLNSMDSSGMSSSSRGGVNGNQHHPPVAPTRKKRMAPRPPSQNSIPEKAPLETCKDDHIFKEPQLPPYSQKNFHVSSPNLYNKELKTADVVNNNHHSNNNNNNNNNADYNGSDKINRKGHHTETIEEMNNIINTNTSYSTLKNRPTSMYIIRSNTTIESHRNGGNLQRASLNGTGSSMQDITVNHSRTSSNSSEVKDPRDFQEAKKSKAPAPPPRSVSLGTKQPDAAIVPTPSPRAPLKAATTPNGARDSDTIISETDSNFSEPDELVKEIDITNNNLDAGKSNLMSPNLSPVHPQNVSKVMLNVDQTAANEQPNSLPPEMERKPTTGASTVSIKIIEKPPITNGHQQVDPKPSTPVTSKVHIVPPPQPTSIQESAVDRRFSNGGNSSDEDVKIYNIETGKEMRIPEKKGHSVEEQIEEEEEQWTYTLPAPPKFADSSIKSSEYDEKQRYFDLQSTFVDNTTSVTDRMTIHSGTETEIIRPIIREKLLVEKEEQTCPSPTVTLNESEGGTSSVTTAEILISSDMEDGYRGGNEIRESMLQTLEKRWEKLKESELQDLKEAIESDHFQSNGKRESVEEKEGWVSNESDIMKCAKLNEETVVNDTTVVAKRSVSRSHSAVETRPLVNGRTFIDSNKSDVISELCQVIKEDSGVKAVLNGKKPEEAEIPGTCTTNLSNFQISAYSEQSNAEDPLSLKPVALSMETQEQTVKSASEDENEVIIRRKFSADSIHRLKLSSDEDDSAGSGDTTSANNNKRDAGPVKRRSLSVLGKSPRNINRSDSFHSTRSDYLQSLNSTTTNGLGLTPRSTSYISLIGAQKFENRFAQMQRRKSTSEMSICDSPSLQSLEVIKNILNTSKSNLAQEKPEKPNAREILPMAAIKRNSFTDISTLVQLKSEVVRSNLVRRESIVERKIEEFEDKKVVEEMEEFKQVENIVSLKTEEIEEMGNSKISDEKIIIERIVDASNESKSDDEKLQNKQLSAAVVKHPQTTVVNISTTSTTVANGGVSVTSITRASDSNEKKWKYQGPPTINFTTWNERPKIDVSIKSDRDYRFGGSSTLPRGYRNVNNTTKINVNTTPAPSIDSENGINRPDSCEHVPLKIAGAHSLSPQPQEANRLEPVSTPNPDRLPIVRAVEYKKNIVPPPVAQKPSEKHYFYDTFSRTSTTPAAPAFNRLSLGCNKFQPIVRGFKSMDEADSAPSTRPASMIESTNVSTAILRTVPSRPEKPAPAEATALPFGQNTLRRTGLKDKILAQSSVVELPSTQTAIVSVQEPVAPPPPPPLAPKLTTPVVRGAIVKKQLPPAEVEPRNALLEAIRNFNKHQLRKESTEQSPQ